VIAEHCQYLERLSVFGCTQVTDVGVSAIARHCSLLHDWSLRGCTSVTGSSLSLISSGSQLRSLNVGGCFRISGASITNVVRQCNQLQRLNLHAIKMTDDDIDAITRVLCNTLVSIHVSSSNPYGGSSLLSDVTLQHLSRCRYLGSINLQGASRITDGGLSFLLSSCNLLERIDVTGCTRLSDRGLAKLVRCPLLTQVSMAMCNALTDDVFTTIITSLPSLTHIDVHQCSQLSTSSLVSMSSLTSTPSLTTVDLGACSGISHDAVLRLQSQRPSLTITHY
jgi:hypothetical protein